MRVSLTESERETLGAMLEALEGGRCLCWTGHVLFEFEHVPDGPVLMVCNAQDFSALKDLARED